MKVADVMADLGKRFPRSPIEAWAQTYLDALGAVSDATLEDAYRRTMREWAENYPPRPAHILASIRAIPKPANDQEKRKPWQIAFDRVRDRAQALFEVACRETGAKPREPFVYTHLWDLAQRVARLESYRRTVADALSIANGLERRPGYPPRHPELWMDEADLEIFAKRTQSQARVMVGKRSA